MKRLAVRTGLLVAGLLAWLADASGQQVGPPALYCNRSFQVSAGATAATQIAAAVANQSIHICGYDANAGAAAGGFQILVGTGANCATNQIPVTPAFSMGINGSMISRNTTVWFSSPQGYALCYGLSGTGPTGLIVSYGQY